MNLTVIDSNVHFAEAVCKKLDVEYRELFGANMDCSEIAKSAADRCKDDESHLIFINVEGNFAGKKQEQKGVEILMWLRCKHRISNPVILYSFQSSHQLLKLKPENLFISSEGCYFFQLPYDFKKMQFTKFEGVKDENRLRKFLKPAFSIAEFRHKEANWWGIKCLWEVYKALFKIDEAKFPYPKELQAWLNSIETVQAIFLLGDDTPQIANCLDDISEENKRITYRESNIEKVKKIRARKLKVLHIDDQNKDGWCKILRHIIYDPTQNITCTFQGDKADYYSNNSLILRSIGTSDFSEVDEFCEYYFTNEKIFEQENWDVILLDLRLFPKNDHLYSRNFEKVSGAVVLDLVKQYYKYNTTPFLVTSASNKAWTLEKITKLGSDAYWIKEGLDNSFTAEETVLNFNKLIDLLDKLTDKQYQSLKEFGKWFEKFDMKNGWWNSSKRWRNGEFILAKSEDIEKLVGESIDHIRIYLQQFHLGYAYKSGYRTNTEAFAISNIINKIGNVVETIHNISDKDYNNTITVGQLVRGIRGDKLGEKIRQERHDASHRKYYTLKWYDLNKVLLMVKEYLSVFPV